MKIDARNIFYRKAVKILNSTFPLVLSGLLATTPIVAASETAQSLPSAVSFSGNYLAGMHAVQSLDTEAAVTYLEKAYKEDPENRSLIRQLVFLQMMKGDFENAFPYANKMVGEDIDGNNLAQLFLSIYNFQKGDFSTASKGLDLLKEESEDDEQGDPFTSFASTILASWADIAKGDKSKAISRMENYEPIAGFDFILYFHTALIKQIAQENEAAEASYKKALEVNARSSRLIESYARFLIQQNRKQDALALIENYAKLNNQTLPSLINSLKNRIEKDLDIAPMVGSAQEGMTEALYNLGLFIGGQGASDLSILLYRLGLKVSDNYDIAEFALANAFQRSSKYEKAIQVFSQIGDSSPLWRSAQIEIANNWRLLDNNENAEAALQKLLDLDKSDRDALMAMGNLMRSSEAYERGSTYFTQVIDQIEKAEPQDWRVYYYRGITYERTKEWPKAEADFKQSLKLNPDEPDVLNYLGYSWIDLNMNFEEALDMIRRAIELNPQNGYIIDSLGWAYFKLERYEEAVEELEKAVTLMPADPILNDHLGDAYWHVGRKREARFQWAHALTMNPEEEDQLIIEKKIETGYIDAEEAKEKM